MRAALLVSGIDPAWPETTGSAPPDLLVIDSEAGAPSLVSRARAAHPGVPIFIRVAPLAGGGEAQLAAMMAARPDGIWLRNAIGRAEIEQLGSILAVAEAELGLDDGATRIIASVDSAAGALAIASLAKAGARLAGITYDLAALAHDIGCEIGPASRYAEPLRTTRANIVLVAAAAGVPAIDSGASHVPDLDAFAADAVHAARDGFSGKLALGSAQIEILRRVAAQLIPPPPLGRWMANFVSGVATK